MHRAGKRVGTLAAVMALCIDCAGPAPRFAPRAPLVRDSDRRPFRAELEPHFTPLTWDRYEKSFFMPASRAFALDVAEESVNVNALDEVPDSSWYQNRIEAVSASAEAMARGPCTSPPLDGSGPWRITSGKPDGVNPGFIIKDPEGQRYLVKFDGGLQYPRALIADVAASRIYYAAGFDVPCNNVVDIDRSILQIAADAKVKRQNGDEEPMTGTHVELALSNARRLANGRYQAMVSRFLAGRSLGTWRYHGQLQGDRNDIVPHEDRRELRGARLLAAWTGHWDHRETNTLAMWIETSAGLGFVRHHLIDFGDCFGAMSARSPQSIWRHGHTHWFEPGQVLLDFATLGLVERPWDRARLGVTGTVFAYYDVDQFDPESWSPDYPNPAFQRMTEHDAAWMARIIARFEPAHLDALIGVARADASLHSELLEILMGRRRKLLERYLARLSPLANPRLVVDGDRTLLCVTDLGVAAGIGTAQRKYSARAWLGREQRPMSPPSPSPRARSEVCAALPADAAATRRDPCYWIVEFSTQQAPARPYPARFHLYHWGGQKYLLVGLERPASFAPPG